MNVSEYLVAIVHRQLAELKAAAVGRRAAFVATPPSVLARNLVRVGPMTHDQMRIRPIIDQLERAVAELPALVP